MVSPRNWLRATRKDVDDAEARLADQIEATLADLSVNGPGFVQDRAIRTVPFATTNTTLGTNITLGSADATPAAGAVLPSFELDVVGNGRWVEITFNSGAARHSVASTGVGVYLLRSTNGGAFTHTGVERVFLGGAPGTTDASNRGLGFNWDLPTVEGETYVFRFGVYGGAAGTSTLPTFNAYPIFAKVRNH